MLVRSNTSKLRFLLFIGRIERVFPKTLRRVYDPAFSKFAQIFVEKEHFLDFSED